MSIRKLILIGVVLLTPVRILTGNGNSQCFFNFTVNTNTIAPLPQLHLYKHAMSIDHL